MTATVAANPRTIDPKNLTPDGVASLLDSAFAEPDNPEAKPAGEEVQTAGKADKTPPKENSAEPDWSPDQKAWFDLRRKATTPEEIAEADAQAPEFSEEQRAWIEAQPEAGSQKSDGGELPSEVLAQVKAWETAGGALPPALQAIVDKRIGREVHKSKEIEQRATAAEAEVERLNAELETRNSERGAAPSGVMDEAALGKLTNASKAFLADARPYVGGYATEEQTARMEKFMQERGLDDKALRQQMDTIGDWLTDEAPAQRQRLAAFKQQQAQAEPIVAARFPGLNDKNSETAKVAAEVVKMMPELASRTPAAKLALGVYALGKLAFEHLSKANNEGDVVAALQEVLTKHVPLPVNGNGNGHGKFFLPGRAPKPAPTGRPMIAPRVNGNRAGQEEAASEELRKNPSADNVTESLRIALR